jgi:DNA-binding NarL/FixJ family response regulator
MSDASPSLDSGQLHRLRALVEAGIEPRRTVLAERTIELAGAASGAATIDWSVAGELGGPLVLLGPRRDDVLTALTPREQEVAVLIAQGLANKQIALRLGITTPTVKDHVHRILQKTGLQNRAAVAAAATRREADFLRG